MKLGKLLSSRSKLFLPMKSLIRWALLGSVKGKEHENSNRQIKESQSVSAYVDRPNFVKYNLENNHEQSMNLGEVDSTVFLLIVAGTSETSGLALVTGTYFSLRYLASFNTCGARSRTLSAKSPRASRPKVSASSINPHSHP